VPPPPYRALLPSLASLAAFLAACTSISAPQPRTSPSVLAPAPAPSPAITAIEPWTFDGHPGHLIRTRWYRLFTTEPDPLVLERLPEFLELCLQRYTNEFGPLPQPPMKLDTFLVANRQQWTTLTRQMMGEQAATYLLIDRGGFSSGGRALLWSIGRYDTLAIAAHEGWHQYTQRTFKDELPTWLEEGIAVYMEGLVRQSGLPLRPQPSGWANLERYDQLRQAARRGQLLPLAELLDARPESLIHLDTDATLTYYAQVWALTHFLREHEGGIHRNALHTLLADAAEGRLQPLLAAAGQPPSGSLIFRIYFDDDLARADARYAQFVMSLLRPGVRLRIAAGESPE
jgi:hypothetical protein